MVHQFILLSKCLQSNTPNVPSLFNTLSLPPATFMDDGDSTQPLITDEPHQIQPHSYSTSTATTVSCACTDDIPPLTGPKDFYTQFLNESKKLWYLAGPNIFSSVFKHSLGAITQVFAGHVGTIDLVAVSVENSVIAGFSFGVMRGMGRALETQLGRANGAGHVDMLGVQRSWVILLFTAMILSLLYIFSETTMKLIGQTTEISEAAARFTVWTIPRLFAYALNFPIAKFLRVQSKVMDIAGISVAALVVHVALSWLLMIKLRWGLAGAAVVLNGSWWFIVVAQFAYIVSGRCGEAWNGFSWKAFQNLWGFVRPSLASRSAVMPCLKVWYFTFLSLFAGYLNNPQVSVDGLSICMNILRWTILVSLGMKVAIRAREKELGAVHPRTAKFSLVVAVITSTLIGLLLAVVLIISREYYPSLFANDTQVQDLVKQLTPLLALCIVINNVQPVLAGVAKGAGWQRSVAYVNVSCYYLFGIPVGLVLGYKLNLGVTGIWCGMMSGTIIQTCVLFFMIYRTNWNTEMVNQDPGHRPGKEPMAPEEGRITKEGDVVLSIDDSEDNDIIISI